MHRRARSSVASALPGRAHVGKTRAGAGRPIVVPPSARIGSRLVGVSIKKKRRMLGGNGLRAEKATNGSS